MNQLPCTCPYTLSHAPSGTVTERRVPYARERLLLPPAPTSAAAGAILEACIAVAWPSHVIPTEVN